MIGAWMIGRVRAPNPWPIHEAIIQRAGSYQLLEPAAENYWLIIVLTLSLTTNEKHAHATYKFLGPPTSILGEEFKQRGPARLRISCRCPENRTGPVGGSEIQPHHTLVLGPSSKRPYKLSAQHYKMNMASQGTGDRPIPNCHNNCRGPMVHL